MRDLISGKLFEAKKKMTDNFIASRVVRGGSRKVEQAMRKEAWDPLSPAAAVSVYLADPSGRVNAAKLVLAGVMPSFDIPDITGIFPKAPEGASMSFGNLDLNGLQFMSSQMSTKWIPDSEFSWNLFVNGKNEQNVDERVSVSAKNYENYHVSNICLRVSAQPISMEKIKIMIGISPVPYNDLRKNDQFDEIGFPIIDITTLIVDIFPQEDSIDGHGIGVKPYLLDKRKDEGGPMPSSSDIKVVVCDLLSRATMPSSKKSTKRWNEAIAKKDWSARPSGKEWPSPLDSDAEDSEPDVSGRNNFS